MFWIKISEANALATSFGVGYLATPSAIDILRQGRNFLIVQEGLKSPTSQRMERELHNRVGRFAIDVRDALERAERAELARVQLQ